MKKQFILGVALCALIFPACSGNRADGRDVNGKDTLYQYSDTNKKDSTVRDSTAKDAPQDSTSNTPRLPGGH